QPRDDGESSVIAVTADDEQSASQAVEVISYLAKAARINGTVTENDVNYAVSAVRGGHASELTFIESETLCLTVRGKPIVPKTAGQKRYVDLIEKNTVVFGVGPAGTGKTFLAVASAVRALRSKTVSRIVITRPAVEAGERLGYLPGDLQSKIDPYLRPLYDALYEMLGPELCQRHQEHGVIEIAPLAYMRGRTLDDSFIILDEAQNTTPEQMKMFLTRLGRQSKAIVTGDPTQTDIPAGRRSGLAEALKILDGIDDIAIHHFTDRDVVRHHLVQKIINAYEKYENSHRTEAANAGTKRYYPKQV
ncbi:MAG: PhoH family protein, partial [Clostridia bacterium]|nr:PhoH family protein [Clostridia bacterium]